MTYQYTDEVSGRVMKATEKYCYLKTNQGTLKLYHDENISYNDTLICQITALDIQDNHNDYAFHEKNYLYSLKVIGKGKITKLISIEHHYNLYHWLEQRFSSKQNIQDYQRLFILGEKSETIQEDYQFLSQLSLVHLFALSGMHIHILFELLKGCFGLMMTQKYSKGLSYLLLGFYIFSIPMSISLYRAFFVLVLYDLLKQWFNKIDVLSLLVIISLFYNPYLVYNTSFVLSYFVYFIVLITNQMKYKELLIYLSTIPIILQFNSQIFIISFLLGICLMPFIEFFYCLCVLTVILPYLEIILGMAVYCLQSILSFLKIMDSYFICSYPTFSFVIMYYYLFFYIIYNLQLHRPVRKLIIALCSLLLVFRIYGEYKIYGEITMIDVGQGDCTFIRLPMNQGNILIDTGGHQDYDIATTTIIPYLKAVGVHQLDYVYISHDDFDHCGALTSLKEYFPITHIIKDFESYREIGDIKIIMLEHSDFSNSNDQSLIMKIEFPRFSVLFMGDASAQVEEELYQKYQRMDIDILKVSHHGSHSASSPLLFQMIQPQVAMIGVKANNMYHHPSLEVIERLKRKKIKILRTDQDGMFHIRYYPNSKYFILI